MTLQIRRNIDQTGSLAALANGSQKPDLTAIGIQLLECLLIPAAVTVVLAVMMWAVYCWWKNRRAAKKARATALRLEEGLASQGEHQRTLQLRRPASPHFKRPDVDGCPTVPVLPETSVIDFAFGLPPTPRFRVLTGADDITAISLGESAIAPPSVSVFDFAFVPPAPPPTPCLRAIEGEGKIEVMDLSESATTK